MLNTCELFNDNWLFVKQKTAPDIKMANNIMHSGNALDWKPIYVPHDWLIYDTNNLYESSVGFYKKEFDIEKNGRLFQVRFDGVYMDSSVYINSAHVGDWKYGYSTFEFDITDFLRDGRNEIIVMVVNESPNSRWYSGAGIYRNVWLSTFNKTHIAPDGVYITPAKISNGTWEVTVDSEINAGEENTHVEVRHTIHDPKGNVVAGCEQGHLNTERIFCDGQTLKVNTPNLWHIDSDGANIYKLKTEVYRDSILTHVEENDFGFRTIEFDPENGFLLNGKRIKLQGVCQHHDLGALGAAMNVTALKRQLRLLKEMGANAIRTAHNMPDPLLMDLADRMGFLIVSEAFDMWELPKT